jgi:hypothetical protein
LLDAIDSLCMRVSPQSGLRMLSEAHRAKEGVVCCCITSPDLLKAS